MHKAPNTDTVPYFHTYTMQKETPLAEECSRLGIGFQRWKAMRVLQMTYVKRTKRPLRCDARLSLRIP